ncbi:MAG: tetratricopeptide repeat protein [Elusimicrobiota bacterium]
MRTSSDLSPALRLIKEGRFAEALNGLAGLVDARRSFAIDFKLRQAGDDVLRSFYMGGMAPFRSTTPSRGVYAAALSVLGDCRSRAPKSAALFVLEGALHNVFQEYPRALRALDRAVILDPGDGWAYLWRFRTKAQPIILGKLNGRREPRLLERIEDALRDLAEAERRGIDRIQSFLWKVYFFNSLDMHVMLQERDLRVPEGLDGVNLALHHAACALNLSGKGAYAQALAHADRTIAALPRLGWAYALKARLFAKADTMGKAVGYMRLALRRAPDEGELVAWMGEAKRRRGDYRGALKELSAAVALDPRSDNAYLWRGKIRLTLGQLEAAGRDLSRTIRLSSMNLQKAYSLRGEVKLKSGDFRGALRDFDRAYPVSPAQTWSERLKNGRRVPERDRAGAMWRDVAALLARNPDDARLHAWRGRLRVDAGGALVESGLADLTRSIELAPRNAWAFAWRGWGKEKSGDAEGAAADYRKAIRIDPDHGMASAFLGRLRTRRGDPRGALRDFKRALGTKFHHAEVLAWQADALWALGRKRASFSSFTEALWLGYRGAEVGLFYARFRGRPS